MSLDPKLAKTLIEGSGEIAEFVDFLRSEVDRLHDLRTLKDVSNDDLPLEVRARERAADILVDILKPLIDSVATQPSTINPKEYVI